MGASNCGTESPADVLCGPANATQSCVCPTGTAGSQTCGEDGAWSVCECAEADAGPDAADGGPDASDGGPDASEDAVDGAGLDTPDTDDIATDAPEPPALDRSAAPLGCPPLPSSTGRATTVIGGDVDGLLAAIDGAEPGDVILLEDGTWDLGGSFLRLDVPGVTLRGASGNRDAVVLDGNGETWQILNIQASDVTVADLTTVNAFNHGVHVTGTSDSNHTGTLIYNVVVRDAGQQAIKVNQSPEGFFPDFGTIACSRLELTDAGRSLIRDNCYTGGIDAHRTHGWRVHDNTIVGFWCESGLSEHGVHFWRTNSHAIVERNLVANCARGIGLGLADSADSVRPPLEPTDCAADSSPDDYAGIVRNNFVIADDPRLFGSAGGFDTGIGAWNACDTRIVHNTVYSTQAPFSSIEWRFDATSGLVANNLVSHNIRERTAGTAVETANVTEAGASWFRSTEEWNLHLEASADASLGVHLEPGVCDEDIDGDPRGPTPDVGADQRAE